MSLAPFRPRDFARKFPFIMPRCYVMGKVLTDPLYPAVFEVLHPNHEPLLDVGCGMGVLAFYLREHGFEPPCTCVDIDDAKISLAQSIQHQWPGATSFHASDAVQALPDHNGSVTLLDMLQYLPHESQQPLLIAAAARVSHKGLLVIRNAMSGGGGRHGITLATDKIARWMRWMGVTPKHYPERQSILDTLAEQGLHGDFQPLWGHTPFHNWLGVFRRTD